MVLKVDGAELCAILVKLELENVTDENVDVVGVVRVLEVVLVFSEVSAKLGIFVFDPVALGTIVLKKNQVANKVPD